jgi:hypothetical protein
MKDGPVFVAGDGIYQQCGWCGKFVKLNKTVFGALHFCLTDDEKKEKLSRPCPTNEAKPVTPGQS